MTNVSNDVLAERIEGYTRTTLAESQQIRRDLGNLVTELGRHADAVTKINDRLTHHESNPGHNESIFRIANVEKQVAFNQKEIGDIKHVVRLVEEVASLEVEVSKLKGRVDSRESFEKGRSSALSSGEKVVLFFAAISGPIIVAVQKL